MNKRLYKKSHLAKLKQCFLACGLSLTTLTVLAASHPIVENTSLPTSNQFVAQASELSAVKAVNASYFNAFKGAPQDNWVYKLANNNELQARCYLSPKRSVEIGGKTDYKNTQMECIQIGQSTRIFWPVRWVDHCQTLKQPYDVCAMSSIKI